MNFFKSLLSVSGTSGTPKPRLVLNEECAKQMTQRAEDHKEITSGDHIAVITKSSGIHLFGKGAYIDYEPNEIYVHYGESYWIFPFHDVVFVRHVIANENIKYMNQ